MASFDQELTIAPVPSRPGRWSERAKLYQQVKRTGLLDRRCGYYALQDQLEPRPARRRVGRLRRPGGLLVAATRRPAGPGPAADRPPDPTAGSLGAPGPWAGEAHDYLRLAWLASALATTRNALGAAVESEASCVSGLRLSLVGAHRTPTGQANHLRVVCSSVSGLPVTPNRIASPQGLG